MWNFKFVAIAVLIQTVNCQVYAQQLQNQNQNVQYQPAVQFQPGQNNVNQQAYQNGQQQQQQQNPQVFQQQQQNPQVFQQQQQPQQPQQQQQQIQSNSQQGTPVGASSNQVFHYSMPGTNFVNNYQSQAGAGPSGLQTSQINGGQLASGSAQNHFITQNEIPSDTTKPFSFNYGHQGPGFLSMLLGSMGIHVGGGGRSRGPPKPGQGKPRPNGPGGSPGAGAGAGAHGSHGSHGSQGPHGPPSSTPTHVGNHLQAVQGLAQQQHIQLSQQSSGGANGPIQYSGSVINSSPFTPYTSSGNTNGGSGNLHYFESPQQIQTFQQQQPLQSQSQPQFIQNQNQHHYQHQQHQQVNPFPSYTSALSDVKYPAPPSPLSAYSSDFPQNSPVSDGSEGTVSIVDGSVFSGSKVMKYAQSDPEVLSFSKHQQHNPKHPHVRVKYEESEPEFSYAHTQEPGGHSHHEHGNSGSTKSKDSHYEPTHAHTLESPASSPHSNDDDMKPYTIIEKPVVHYIDKPVVRFIEKTVVRTVEKPVIKYVEKPVIQYKYVQMPNPTPSHLKNFNSGPLNPSYTRDNSGYQSNSINVGKEGEAYESDDQMPYTQIKTEGEGQEIDSSESGEEGFKAPTIKIIHHYHTQSMDSPQNMEPQKVAHHQNSPGGAGPHIGSGENKDNSEFYSSYGGAYYRKNAAKIPAKTIGLKDDEKLEANFDDNAFKTPLIHIPKELPVYAPQDGKYEIIKTHIYGPSVSSLHGNHHGHGQQAHLVQSNSSPVGQVQMMSTSASTANTATTVAVPLPVEAREQFLVNK